MIEASEAGHPDYKPSLQQQPKRSTFWSASLICTQLDSFTHPTVKLRQCVIRMVCPSGCCCSECNRRHILTAVMRACRVGVPLARPLWTRWHAVLLSALPLRRGRHVAAFSSGATALRARPAAERLSTDHSVARSLRLQLRQCHSVDGLLSLLVSQHADLNLLHYTAALLALTDMLAPNSKSTLAARSPNGLSRHPGWQLLVGGLSERVSGLQTGELVSVMDCMRRLYAVLAGVQLGVESAAEEKEIDVFGWYWRFTTTSGFSKHAAAEQSTAVGSAIQATRDGASELPFNRLLAALLQTCRDKLHHLSADESALLLHCLSWLARLHPHHPTLLTTAHDLTHAIARNLPSYSYSLSYLSLLSTSLYRLHRICHPLERATYPAREHRDTIHCPPHQVRFQLVMGIALTLTDVQKALLDATRPHSILHLSHVLEAVCIIAEDGAWDGLLEAAARALIGRVRELSGHEISRLLLCFSRLQLSHDTLYGSLAERVLHCMDRRGEVRTEHLVDCMFALVWLRRHWSGAAQSLLAAIVARLSTDSELSRLRRLTQQQHVKLAWSLTVVQLPASVSSQRLLRGCLSCLSLHNGRSSAMSLMLLYELSIGLPAQLHAQLPTKLLSAARKRYRAFRAGQPAVPPDQAGLVESDAELPRGRFAYCLPWPDQLESSNEALLWWVDDTRYMQRYGARGEAMSAVQWIREQLHKRRVPVVEVGWRERRELKQANPERKRAWLKVKVAEAEARVRAADANVPSK